LSKFDKQHLKYSRTLVTILNHWLLCKFDTAKKNKYARETGIKTQSISLICCICTYFCIICFSQISRFLCRISAKAFAGSKTNKFYDKVIFFRTTCLLDNLKELLLNRSYYTSWHLLLHNDSLLSHRNFLRILIFVVTWHTFPKTPFCIMTSCLALLIQSILVIHVLKPIFHCLILHDFMHAYLSELHTLLYSFFQFIFGFFFPSRLPYK